MKRINFRSISVSFSLTALLLFCACSDDSDSSVNATSLNMSSDSVLDSSSDVSNSETKKNISSSSVAVSSESGSSVADNPVSSSSSLSADFPTFSKYLAQFVAPDENTLDFDSHVMAYNTYFSIKCEDEVVSYDESEEMILLKSISNENIAECFPKTTEFLNKKFSSKDNVKFYVVSFNTGVAPLAFVLDKFTSDTISTSVVSPSPELGKNCYQETTGPIAIFLIADTEGLVKKRKYSNCI